MGRFILVMSVAMALIMLFEDYVAIGITAVIVYLAVFFLFVAASLDWRKILDRFGIWL